MPISFFLLSVSILANRKEKKRENKMTVHKNNNNSNRYINGRRIFPFYQLFVN